MDDVLEWIQVIATFLLVSIMLFGCGLSIGTDYDSVYDIPNIDWLLVLFGICFVLLILSAVAQIAYKEGFRVANQDESQEESQLTKREE